MDIEHWATIVSAIIGIVGTALLFFYSNTDIPFEAATWGGPETHENNEKIAAKNRSRKLKQKIGFGLLCLSFIIQASTAVILSIAAR
jgi:hypothetical protein